MTTPMRRAFYVFLGTVALGAMTVAVLAYWVFSYPERPGGTARGPVEIEIPRGAAAGQVSTLLEQAGLVDRPTLFRLYTGQRGAAARIRPGHYKFQAPVTPKQIVDTLIKGVADQLISVTLPEGRHLVEVADLLAAAGVTKREEFLSVVTSAEVARSLDIPAPSLEGYLYPDTYRLRPGMPARDVAVHLLRRHRQVFEELRNTHADGLAKLRKTLGWDDHKVVILASIVEKETARPEERPRIAQLFLNRLTKPSFRPKLLQTDPTIIYGCTVGPLILGKASEACKQFKDNDIRRIHLDDRDNPYSTYANEGLPPGPISNPGRDSLAAVMKPDGSPYLYFVAYGDGSGRHFFSSTVAEHEAAVVKYQRGGRPMPKAKN